MNKVLLRFTGIIMMISLIGSSAIAAEAISIHTTNKFTIEPNYDESMPYRCVKSKRRSSSPCFGNKDNYTQYVSSSTTNLEFDQPISKCSTVLLSKVISQAGPMKSAKGELLKMGHLIKRNLPNQFRRSNVIVAKTTIYRFHTVTPGVIYRKYVTNYYYDYDCTKLAAMSTVYEETIYY